MDKNESDRDSQNASKAAGQLSKLGAAKGGEERARKLSPERRKEIAQTAIEARWAKAGKPILPKATHSGELQIGNISIPCAVLEDGTRILWQQGFLRAIGRTGRAASAAVYDENNESFQLPVFLRAENLKPFITDELIEASKPIRFKPAFGGTGRYGAFIGYNADLVRLVCTTFLDAADTDALKANQQHILERCKILIRGLAKVGIVALVDEATGYQYDRARDELIKILDAYVQEELRVTPGMESKITDHVWTLAELLRA